MNGQIDMPMLKEWADTIENDEPHVLTTLLPEAVVEKDVRGKK